MMTSGSFKSFSNKPIVKTAGRVSLDKHDKRMFVLYYMDVRPSATPCRSSTKAKNIFDCACHSSKKSLNSSKSNLGVEPYGLNALATVAMLERLATFALRSSALLARTDISVSWSEMKTIKRNMD